MLDFGYGFGENLFALSNAYPNGKIYGIDCNPVCQKEVGEKLAPIIREKALTGRETVLYRKAVCDFSKQEK